MHRGIGRAGAWLFSTVLPPGWRKIFRSGVKCAQNSNSIYAFFGGLPSLPPSQVTPFFVAVCVPVFYYLLWPHGHTRALHVSLQFSVVVVAQKNINKMHSPPEQPSIGGETATKKTLQINSNKICAIYKIAPVCRLDVCFRVRVGF